MIAMNDFRAEPAELRAATMAAVERVVDSGWYILGRECESFERAFAARCEVAHAIGVGNGMDAIEIGLRALGVGAGDEVVTTSMTAFATVLAILRCGAEPVLADIDPESGLLDIESVRRCLSPRTRAVVPVHLYGQARDLDRWAAFASEAGIHLVEDCAQAHLARWQGRPAGSFGAVGAFSFYPTKNLGALGDGGLATTGDAHLAESMRKLRNYGQSERYHHPVLGLNSRLDEMQAAILSVRLGWLDAFTERRRAIAAAYDAGLRGEVVRPLAPPADPASHVHHLYVVRTEARAAFADHMKARGVQTLIHYPIPVHRQDPCRDLRCDPAGLSATERHAETCISLPCHPQMSDADVAQVIEAVAAFEAR